MNTQPTPQSDPHQAQPTTPLGRTTLSALVDAAGQAQQSAKPITRATVATITSLVGVISAVLIPMMILILHLSWQVAIGIVMIFIGVSIGWTQMSFITNPAPYIDESAYSAMQSSSSRQSAIAATSVQRHNKLVSIAVATLALCIAVTGVLMICSIAIRLQDLIIGALAGVLMLAVIAIIIAPWWMSLLADLGAQRAKTANEALRADIATRLHDSVLQTLALIRLHADESQTVASLARMQERELRAWLYTGQQAASAPASTADPTTETTDPQTSAGYQQPNLVHPKHPHIHNGMPLEQAVAALAAYVEDTRQQAIEVVTVGQASVSDATLPILDAATEAMHNAAQYGSTPITVYCEVQHQQSAQIISIFIRDHGQGFDTEHLPQGHMGIRESIIGRMRRAGGEARIISKPQWGTEVRLTLRIVEQS